MCAVSLGNLFWQEGVPKELPSSGLGGHAAEPDSWARKYLTRLPASKQRVKYEKIDIQISPARYCEGGTLDASRPTFASLPT